MFFDKKETPEEYAERRARQQEEYETRQYERERKQREWESRQVERAQKQREWEARQVERDRKQREWEARQLQKQQRQSSAAGTKRNLIAKAESNSSSSDWKKTGSLMKALMDDWKTAGHAGDIDQSLWQQFQSARQHFYDRRTEYFEKIEVERKKNLSLKENVVSKMGRLATCVNPKEAKMIRSQMKELMSEWKNIGHVSKQDNDRLWAKMSESMATIDNILRSHFQTQQFEREKAEKEKRDLISQASSLSSTSNWKDGKQKARNLRDKWKSVGFAGRDKEESLWRDFNGALDTFYQNMNRYYEEKNREYENNSRAKQNLISQAQRIVNDTTDFTEVSGKRAMQSLMQEWKKTKSAGRDEGRLWEEFCSLQDEFYSKSKDAFSEKDKDWEKSREFDYGRNRLTTRNKDGKAVGTYSTGDLGFIHKTDSHYGGGKTTGHPDSSSHHHGDHSHVLGRASKEGGSSHTRDGKPTRK